jgi:YVTN family beta-propeller protein
MVRVYITNAAGDSIHVIDPVTNKVVQEIKNYVGAHGIDFSPWIEGLRDQRGDRNARRARPQDRQARQKGAVMPVQRKSMACVENCQTWANAGVAASWKGERAARAGKYNSFL